MVFGYVSSGRCYRSCTSSVDSVQPAIRRCPNACRRPFHLINYLGSCGGGQILTPQAMVALLDRTVRALHRNLSTETDEACPNHALPDRVGPLLQADHERPGRLPLRHPAL